MSEYQKVRLQVSHGPDTHFEGKILHEFSTQRKDGGKSRWTELRLWETRGGAWVTESVGCSTQGNEREIREVAVIDDVQAAWDLNRSGAARTANELEEVRADPMNKQRIRQVMEAWGWTTASKAFAREMGWDVIRRVR
jgi:hypothetical protein